jgi:hypothetical protein
MPYRDAVVLAVVDLGVLADVAVEGVLVHGGAPVWRSVRWGDAAPPQRAVRVWAGVPARPSRVVTANARPPADLENRRGGLTGMDGHGFIDQRPGPGADPSGVSTNHTGRPRRESRPARATAPNVIRPGHTAGSPGRTPIPVRLPRAGQRPTHPARRRCVCWQSEEAVLDRLAVSCPVPRPLRPCARSRLVTTSSTSSITAPGHEGSPNRSSRSGLLLHRLGRDTEPLGQRHRVGVALVRRSRGRSVGNLSPTE